MKRSPDKYDEAIAYLGEHPEEILHTWIHWKSHRSGCLFKFVSPHGKMTALNGRPVGCLTMIREMEYSAYDPELNESIRNDEAIPSCGSDITLAHLPRFAYWQRKLDKHWKKMEQGVTR